MNEDFGGEEHSIESILLSAFGVGKGAIELADAVRNLEVVDSNIKEIDFSYGTIKGYAGAPFVKAEVGLYEPFANMDQFKTYLEKHNLPNSDASLWRRGGDPLDVGFRTNVYTKSAFSARFFQK